MKANVWETRLVVDAASTGKRHGDTVYLGLCLSQVLMVWTHALHARAGRWVTN